MVSWCLGGARPQGRLVTPVLFMLSTAVISISGQLPQVDPQYTHLSSLTEYDNCVDINVDDVALPEGETRNLTVNFIGNSTKDITLMFQISGNNVLEPIDNILEKAGSGINSSSEISLTSVNVGHAVMFVNTTPSNMTDVSGAFVRIAVYRSSTLDYTSEIVGWMYFVAWSFSFYPQTYSNWKRKSVIGLHFDFLTLNIIGFFVYSMFNICLYAIPEIEKQYFQRHPYGINPVQLNDVIFSIHAFFACAVQVVQCFIYERGDQQVSKTAKWIISAISVSMIIAVILGVSNAVQWLEFLYFISYIKLFITLIKYIPQAYYNYQRKSTTGWSIGNVLLDFTGGSLSIAQMFILAYNYNDWSSIFGDPTKFGLGLFSIIFDVFFMVQHYILYRVRVNDGYQPILETPPHSYTNSMTESVHSSTDYGSVHRV